MPAPASVPEFLVKLLGEKNGLNLLAVPYRGSAPMIGDMLGNQISAGVGSVPDLIVNHQQKKLRIVAVMGQQRQAVLPEVPTFAELGIAGFEDLPYYGLYAPAGTPTMAYQDSMRTAAMTSSQNNDSGISTFQPTSISWS